MLNGLDLFSGIGGISIALSEWVRTVAYCEQNQYAQAVLLSRMADGAIDRAPIWDDVASLNGAMLPSIDIIFGGFPCQDISIAGLGKGLEGERSGLFFDVTRLISELRPRFVFLENVPSLTLRGLDRVCLEITSLGYDCRWTIVSASEVGACHLRERIWILGHSNSFDGKLQKSKDINTFQPSRISDTRIIDRTSKRFVEPRVGRTGNGVPSRMDRIKCLGNSVVPIQAKEAFKRLCGLK